MSLVLQNLENRISKIKKGYIRTHFLATYDFPKSEPFPTEYVIENFTSKQIYVVFKQEQKKVQSFFQDFDEAKKYIYSEDPTYLIRFTNPETKNVNQLVYDLVTYANMDYYLKALKAIGSEIDVQGIEIDESGQKCKVDIKFYRFRDKKYVYAFVNEFERDLFIMRESIQDKVFYGPQKWLFYNYPKIESYQLDISDKDTFVAKEIDESDDRFKRIFCYRFPTEGTKLIMTEIIVPSSGPLPKKRTPTIILPKTGYNDLSKANFAFTGKIKSPIYRSSDDGNFYTEMDGPFRKITESEVPQSFEVMTKNEDITILEVKPIFVIEVLQELKGPYPYIKDINFKLIQTKSYKKYIDVNSFPLKMTILDVFFKETIIVSQNTNKADFEFIKSNIKSEKFHFFQDMFIFENDLKLKIYDIKFNQSKDEFVTEMVTRNGNYFDEGTIKYLTYDAETSIMYICPFTSNARKTGYTNGISEYLVQQHKNTTYIYKSVTPLFYYCFDINKINDVSKYELKGKLGVKITRHSSLKDDITNYKSTIGGSEHNKKNLMTLLQDKETIKLTDFIFAPNNK
jgi:hypothetical protein